MPTKPPTVRPGPWLATIRRYLLAATAGNLVWETLQLPLYTIWQEPPAQMAFAVLHCTAGDLLIALGALTGALVIAGTNAWPRGRYRTVAAIAMMAGVAYTVFSERSNLARGSWTYSGLMPIAPILEVGLSSLLQWVIVPLLAFRWARRPEHDTSRTEEIVP